MRGPGQNLEDLVSNMTLDNVKDIVGQDVLETVSAIHPLAGISSASKKIAHKFLSTRPEEMFTKRNIRKICYDAMAVEKLDELAHRLGLEDRHKLQSLDPTNHNTTWQQYLGFFGIDTRVAAPLHIEPDIQNVTPDFGLFSHQRRAADRVWDALGEGYGRVVLHMPTGAGKTRTAMHIVSRFHNLSEPSLIIWLAASGELLEQAADAFQEAWSRLGNRELALLRFWGDHTPDLSGITDGLVVAGLQKLHSLASRDSLQILRLAARVKLVVVDEAHQAIAPTYRELITKLAETGSHNALLGLTATPGRSWTDVAADEKLSAFFGERKVTLAVDGWDDPVSYLMEEGYLAKPTFHKLEYNASPELHLDKVAVDENDYDDSVLDQLSNDTNRNISIINEINRLIDTGHKRILLFTASVKHAYVVAATLSALDVDARVITGTTPSLSRKRIIKDFRSDTNSPIVLCNFGVLTTGFDAPNTSAAVIARPTRSLVLYSQMVGRATRGPEAGGNERCEISTVVDVDLPGFGDVAEAFTNWEDVWNEPSS